MSKNTTNEFNMLTELLRKANNLINPISYSKQLDSVLHNKMHYQKCSKCYLSLASRGRDNLLFPICNMTGTEDPRFIRFSLKLANRLKALNKFDNIAIDGIIKKLENLNIKFSKEIPKPSNMAAQKGKITKNFNIVDKYIKEKIRPND